MSVAQQGALQLLRLKGSYPLIPKPNLGSHSNLRLRLLAFFSKGLNLGRTQGAVEKGEKKTKKPTKFI